MPRLTVRSEVTTPHPDLLLTQIYHIAVHARTQRPLPEEAHEITTRWCPSIAQCGCGGVMAPHLPRSSSSIQPVSWALPLRHARAPRRASPVFVHHVGARARSTPVTGHVHHRALWPPRRPLQVTSD